MYKYHVESNHLLTATTILLTLKRYPLTKHFSFQPGQYAAISFKHKGRPTPARCFSITNSPTEQGILQFSIRKKGRFTKAVCDLKKGDEILVRGPFGGFVFDAERDRDVVMIAGGIGVAPFMSMIQLMKATKTPHKVRLIYSFKSQDDVPFFDSIINFDKSTPNFSAQFVVSGGYIGKFAKNVKSGRITPDIINEVVEGRYHEKSFFICGPLPFMNAMSKILREKGVPDNMIITEAFSQGPGNNTGKLRSWPNNIYVLGAVGVVVASLAVTVKDILKALPASSFLTQSNLIDSEFSTNSRQTELDNLVNGIKSTENTSPVSDAVKKSQQSSNTRSTAPVSTT